MIRIKVESAIAKCQSTNDNEVKKYDDAPIRSILDRCIITWSDVEIGYFLYNYSDPNNRDAMAKELGISSDGLYSMYTEVLNEYRRRRCKNS
jgi:hypothetical protein